MFTNLKNVKEPKFRRNLPQASKITGLNLDSKKP
jgi:hypothetical protein